MFASESTVTEVLSDSQFDRELSSSTVHNADVMLSCRSMTPVSGPDLCSLCKAREVTCNKRVRVTAWSEHCQQIYLKCMTASRRHITRCSCQACECLPLRQHPTLARHHNFLAWASPAQALNAPCKCSTHGPEMRKTVPYLRKTWKDPSCA